MRSHAQPERLSFKGGMSWRKATLILFVSLFLASLTAGAYLGIRYTELNPKVPETETGRVRRYLAYKTYVYVAEREETVSRLLFVSWFGSFLALMCLGVRWKFMTVAGSEPQPLVTYRRKNE